jgi:hypothetical protein
MLGSESCSSIQFRACSKVPFVQCNALVDLQVLFIHHRVLSGGTKMSGLPGKHWKNSSSPLAEDGTCWLRIPCLPAAALCWHPPQLVPEVIGWPSLSAELHHAHGGLSNWPADMQRGEIPYLAPPPTPQNCLAAQQGNPILSVYAQPESFLRPPL